MQLVYKSKAKKAKPKPPIIKNALAAFLVGGIICTLGQIVLNTFTINGFTDNEAGMMTSIFLIVISALLTGLGVYDEIGKFAGAGSMVPITGFANSIVSSALEFKREGYVYGIGAKVFTIAGPVLLYGTLVSALIGLIYYIIL
ncbi:stage V sporulation protein AC [Desulfonispora thiosulfatigenes]|nr:stage V sporulation protein AC [Desulfonispora thiosulfatigenes]